MKQLNVSKSKFIYADAAELKSIEEIKRSGFNIVPCPKGPGSVAAGIALVQQYPMNITKRSTETIKERRNYQWLKDRDGKYINEPMDYLNHSMDAIRYGVYGRKNKGASKFLDYGSA